MITFNQLRDALEAKQETIKVRITAKERITRKLIIIFMNVKLVFAFSRDSGGKVGYKARLISGNIGSGGSRVNWYCYADEGSVFELEVDKEFFDKNKNRIKKWEIEVIEDFTCSKERADAALAVQQNLE